MKYVIHKLTRTPSYESYSGATWDQAGLRRKWQPTYEDKAVAERLAKVLTEHNPVGFKVSKAEV